MRATDELRRQERQRRRFSLLPLAVLVLMASCDRGKEEKRTDLTIYEWLDVCSPFESFDGARMLEFEIKDRSVKLTEAVGDERAKGALMADSPTVVRGTWSADETTRGIVVDVGGTKATYTLVIPFSEGECILSAGTISAADLRNSWFGEPSFEPDTSDRDPYP